MDSFACGYDLEIEAAQHLSDLAADMPPDESCSCLICEQEVKSEEPPQTSAPEETAAEEKTKTNEPNELEEDGDDDDDDDDDDNEDHDEVDEEEEEKEAEDEEAEEEDEASVIRGKICESRKEAAFLALSSMDKVLRKRPDLRNEDPEESPDLRTHLLRMGLEDKLRLLWRFHGSDAVRAEMVAEFSRE